MQDIRHSTAHMPVCSPFLRSFHLHELDDDRSHQPHIGQDAPDLLSNRRDTVMQPEDLRKSCSTHPVRCITNPNNPHAWRVCQRTCPCLFAALEPKPSHTNRNNEAFETSQCNCMQTLIDNDNALACVWLRHMSAARRAEESLLDTGIAFNFNIGEKCLLEHIHHTFHCARCMPSFKAIPEKEPVKWPAVSEPLQVGKCPEGCPNIPDESNSCHPACRNKRPHIIRATSTHFELNMPHPILEKAFNLACFEPVKAAVCKQGSRLLPPARPCTCIVDSDSPLTSTSRRVNFLKQVEHPERAQMKLAISAKTGLGWENILHGRPSRPQPTGPDSPVGRPRTIKRKVIQDCLKNAVVASSDLHAMLDLQCCATLSAISIINVLMARGSVA